MIRAKLILRNVINKPLRAIIIILSLAAAAFAALFCISGISIAQNSLTDYFRANFGDSDIIMVSRTGMVIADQSDMPQGFKMSGVVNTSTTNTKRNTRFPNYVNEMSVGIIGIDTKMAAEMKLLSEAFPTDDGITVTEPVARQFGKKVGDTFPILGKGNKQYNMKILAIAKPEKFIRDSYSIITTPDFANEVSGKDKNSYTMALIDTGETDVGEGIGLIHSKFPAYTVYGTVSSESEDSMASMYSIYYLIFAVVFLMVGFIIVSMSKHIAVERMSVIGMLRSIGGSIAGTSVLLLAESAFYGLCGGLLGTLLFLPLRGNTSIGFFAVAGGEGVEFNDNITPLTVILVILAVILMQCLFSAVSVIRASRTPVRDIIFGTKETAYLPSKMLSVVGIISFILGIAAYLMFDDFTMTIAAAFFSAIGAVMLFPLVVSLVSKGLSALFAKLNMPVAKLAIKEVSTKKSSISSSQLILSAMSLSVSVVVIAAALIESLVSPAIQSEIIIKSPVGEGSRYDYIVNNIDGVTDMEKVYYNILSFEDKAELNGEERDLSIFGMPDDGLKYYTGIKDCPKLEKNEAAIDRLIAGKLGIGIGDEITLSLKLDKLIPTRLKLKVKSYCDSTAFNSLGNTIVINLDQYKSIYYDNPEMILVKTQPGTQYSVLDIMHSTMTDYPDNIMTAEDYNADILASMQSILVIVYAVVVLGLALSLLGTSSNMFMGFEQSRRKYAVYYSSSMSKDKLKRLILLETVFTVGISVIFSVILGMYFLGIISKALSMLYMNIAINDPHVYALIFGAAAFVILLVTAIRPVSQISKMNIAEEIKTGAD